jgi:DNA-binding GntR family transcriptional regulator
MPSETNSNDPTLMATDATDATDAADAPNAPNSLGALLGSPIARVSLVGDVAARLRKSIVGSILKPGDPIVESQLAERLGVSRGTIREAVRLLAGEGLLIKNPNAIARVADLTPEKAWEVYSMRVVLEGFAARLLAQRLLPAQLARLNDIWRRMMDAADSSDRASFSDWDFALHEAIVELSGHETLIESWRRLGAWISLAFAVQDYAPEMLRRNALDHRRVIDAIASGDAAEAERVTKQDLKANLEVGAHRHWPEVC